jgi:acetyl-CoA carboxylase carboxyltransferase component
MYPNTKISVIGGEQVALTLLTAKIQQLKAKGLEMSEKEQEEFKNKILEKYEQEGIAYYSSSRLWDDSIIDPIQTRNILAKLISISINSPFKKILITQYLECNTF